MLVTLKYEHSWLFFTMFYFTLDCWIDLFSVKQMLQSSVNLQSKNFCNNYNIWSNLFPAVFDM